MKFQKKNKREFAVTFEGFNIARVVQRLTFAGMEVYDINKSKSIVKMTVFCSSKDEIFDIITKGGGENIQILEKLPKDKVIKALPILLGVCCFVAVILFSGLFVFRVSVTGEEEQVRVMIENMAKEHYPFGSFKSEEKLEMMKTDLENSEEIAFFQCEIIQNTLHISFIKAENPVVEIKQKNVVSPFDGTILNLVTFEGTPQKKAGDEVKKGDVLIASYLDNAGVKTEIENAKGVGLVQGRIEIEIVGNLLETQKVYTNRIEEVKYYEMFGKEVFKKESSFENFEMSNKKYNIIENSSIYMVEEKRREFVIMEVENTQEDIEERAKNLLKEKYLSDFAYTIVKEETFSSVIDGQVTAKAVVEFIVEIS